MKLKELTYLLQHPQTVNTLQTDMLFNILETYPYFQSVKAIYLKGLKQKNSYKYNNTLKTTAAYTTDRSVLFDYITSDVFNQNEISKQIQQSSAHIKEIEVTDKNDISIHKSVVIDDVLKAQVKGTEGVLDPELFKPKPIKYLKKETVEKEEAAEAEVITSEQDKAKLSKTLEKQLEIGKPLAFDKSESHSFSEWLKITTYKPIVRDVKTPEVQTPEISPLEDKLAIIDRFIKENPKIKPVSNKNTFKEKLVIEDNELSDSLMTETLARIYLEQKNYDKAIQSYKILSLKYPEKSSFFADQLKLIQELKDNI